MSRHFALTGYSPLRLRSAISLPRCTRNDGALDPTAWAVEAVEPGSDFPRSAVGVIMARVKPGTPDQYSPMPAPISIVDAARELRAGKLTPLELLDRCLEQIHKHEDAVHAWVLVDEVGARQTATRADPRGSARPSGVGPCTGFPLVSRTLLTSRGLPPGRDRRCADIRQPRPTRRWSPPCVGPAR